MKTFLAFLLLPALFAFGMSSAPPDWLAIKARAEDLYARGSFEMARRAYQEADASALAAEDRRWLEFRLADTRWRSAAAAENNDTTEIDAARTSLEALQTQVTRLADRDRVWALIEESLGDWRWQRRNSRDWGGAQQHYSNALDWWSGARDVESARKRYLSIVFRMGWPEGGKGDSGWWTGNVPIAFAENAVRIATDPQDKAQALFLYATVVRNTGGDYDAQVRRFEALRAVIAMGRTTRFYDDALARLANAEENGGEPKVAEDGSWTIKPDFVAALALYRRITKEFKKGDTAYFDEARQAIERITRVEVGVSVASTFLPDSEIGYVLAYRNAAQIDLALYPVDLSNAVKLTSDRSWSSWLESIDTSKLTASAAWQHETKDAGLHAPASLELRLEKKLAPGSYVLEARVGKVKSRDLVLVTTTTLTVKAVGTQVLVWCTDALTSEPIAGATVRLIERGRTKSDWRMFDATKTSADDGTALFELKAKNDHEFFAVVKKGERTAYAGGGSADYNGPDGRWKLYAFTDRSTYRPGHEVQWKLIARTQDGGALKTPAKETLEYEIHDPRGQSVKKATLTLSDFGAAWAAFTTDDTMPLGEYRVDFKRGTTYVGSATLFRLEEYKLPEYEVSVKPADDDGKRKSFVVGDKVEVEIAASFYSGGAVADADVAVIVRQNPFWRRWKPVHEFAWYYDDESNDWDRYGRRGQVVKELHVKTDAAGKARITFDTPRDLNQDYEYTIEARVTDASRREVSGSGTVRVTRREYEINARATSNLHQPGSKVEFAFEAKDANDEPVAATGSVRITRERWVEIWIDPLGREILGKDLEDLRAHTFDFPPPTKPGERPWRLKKAEYASDEILTGSLTLDAKGQGTFAFTPERAGYYKIHWTSKDGRKHPIESDAFAWVLKEDTHELGYRVGGIEVLVDKDSFVAGEKAPVMLSLASSNRWVLFTVEGERLHSWQVVHVEGTVKLVNIALGEEHVPNVFVSATSTFDGHVVSDTKAVVVPPVKQFLTVDVKPDRDPVLPGSKGFVDIVAKNFAGEPVPCEFALSVVDESVSAIQSEYAGDIRQFFYGEKRQLYVATHTSFDARPYARYVLDADGKVVDERVAEALRNQRDEADVGNGRWAERSGRFDSSDLRGLVAGKAGNSMAPQGTSKRRGGAVPAAPAASEMLAMDQASAGAKKELKDGDSEPGSVQVRSDFRETALWQPNVTTDASGRARVEVQYPDSLTRWKATARGAGRDGRFGFATATVRANKPLVARLQAPRFFTVGDEALVSGVIDNRTDNALTVMVQLAVDGGLVCANLDAVQVVIPAQGEQRVDWKMSAVRASDVQITLSAISHELSDAMVKTYPVQDHGIEVQIARSLKAKDPTLVATLDIPKDRAKESTRFTIDVAPSLAVTMLDALPYLVDYPYGCTEQTLSRFLPAAIVANTLRSRGLSPEDAMKRAFGGIEPETAGKTHPSGKRSLEELDAVTRASLDRLYDFQHSDGGWGWWKEGESDPWMTAYVVWGLSIARDAKLDVKLDAIARGAQFLSLEIVKSERTPDLAAFELFALGASGLAKNDARVEAAFTKLWEQKNALNAYGRSLFALAAHTLGHTDEAKVLCENLANGAQIDLHPDASRLGQAGQPAHDASLATAHWGANTSWWRWHEGPVESTAFALKALATIDPKNPLVEQAVNWLVQNRRGAQWNNTRDTAIAILALDTFLNASGEISRDVAYELVVNGETIATKSLSAADMLTAPAHFVVDAAKVKDGANEIKLVRTRGDGPLYLAARCVFTSREEKIPARGSDIFVRRQYWKLVPRETLLKGVVYEREPLLDEGTVASGERVEVLLTLESKNDFEYLMFEDNKPAGLEAAELKSGDNCYALQVKASDVATHIRGANSPDANDSQRFTGVQRACHQELRDKKVALFLDRLPQGIWEVRYELRAEVPGHFHALPTQGSAMYVPEIRCNGDETRVTVKDRGTQGD